MIVSRSTAIRRSSCRLLGGLILLMAAAAISEAGTIFDTTSSTGPLNVALSPATT